MLDLLGSMPKDNCGYDLKQLFIGSEGALALPSLSLPLSLSLSLSLGASRAALARQMWS